MAEWLRWRAWVPPLPTERGYPRQGWLCQPLPMMASRARSSIAANGPAARLATWDSTPACGRVGAIASASLAARPIRASSSPLNSAPSFGEFVLLLVFGVFDDRVAQLRQFASELLAVDVELFQLLQNGLGFVLFVQTLADDGGAVGDLAFGAGVNDLFLRGFVHGEQPPKLDEGLLAGLSGRRQGLGEHRFDLLVLADEEVDHVGG